MLTCHGVHKETSEGVPLIKLAGPRPVATFLARHSCKALATFRTHTSEHIAWLPTGGAQDSGRKLHTFWKTRMRRTARMAQFTTLCPAFPHIMETFLCSLLVCEEAAKSNSFHTGTC